ncbi:riboflavin biosynthesis protein RibF [Streptococcus pyogenes]|uniref:bifunctional riboflavin kinase/FAD synthetase n=1 Tax=Streptococcus pyogenes TaxID=1314 RepID=UPI0010A13FC9|nr:bifunctional riboflavin kinase/FAD synthetase [Streptococcus pyogenes]VHI67382.1 riboflavin biosynthesis protein RibF [Streptococcus pyogenes]VHI70839.1 riboflavin biosynthesis protein RibF [Streptococcus pyogenes]VHI92362.1 riboflavin biosynthesis protein RibF [Streptococcus pyogenes]VHJ03362.1 riboflavin biosynthesis protein RibF [Streptococcus pyogenes]VHJ77406.1 riboflavin biosynthesis protein RibF [Streptococcus pyogenes]
MEIEYIKDYRDINQEDDTVLVLGYFDGLHRGHKVLFDKAREVANKEGLKVVVFTFTESPKLAFSRFSPELLLHITYPKKRYEKFADYGVNKLYLVDFTSKFSKVSSDHFITHYIKNLKAKHIVVGFDYKFGHNCTDSDYLTRNFEGQVYTIKEIKEDHRKISATWIRKLIQEGNVVKANHLLGYDLSTRGRVVHGDARGRTIGFPTANLAPIDNTYLPADGVYVTNVIVANKIYRSMTSLGKNVTFGGKELRLEVNIFDFDEEIYGEIIEIVWLDKIRDMEKFEGIEDLTDRLEYDKRTALNWKKDSKLS